MQGHYQDEAIVWLSRAFDHNYPMTAEECLDRAVACLRMAALSEIRPPEPPAPGCES